MSLEKLKSISSKKTKTAIGLMSGTSLDGVDAVIVEIEGCGTSTKIKELDFIETQFPEGLKETLIRNSTETKGSVDEICRLNFLLARIYADAVKKLIEKTGIKMENIDFIGSHGQTIFHAPQAKNYFGYDVRSTLQIGDPSVLAKLTGIIVAGDFRVGDVALGGQGAPLVPYYDYLLYRSDKNRALLNIGGISNITFLQKNAEPEDVLAFDCGPGNMLIDYLSRKFFNVEYDKDGNFAKRGKINASILNDMISRDKFIEAKPPKSTGREYYGKQFIEDLFEKYSSVSGEDWIATATFFTGYAVRKNYDLFAGENKEIKELLISGGGAKNEAMLAVFEGLFPKADVSAINKIGYSADSKEALCFAVLANETLCGIESNLPSVTGASKRTILGKICLP